MGGQGVDLSLEGRLRFLPFLQRSDNAVQTRRIAFHPQQHNFGPLLNQNRNLALISFIANHISRIDFDSLKYLKALLSPCTNSTIKIVLPVLAKLIADDSFLFEELPVDDGKVNGVVSFLFDQKQSVNLKSVILNIILHFCPGHSVSNHPDYKIGFVQLFPFFYNRWKLSFRLQL